MKFNTTSRHRSQRGLTVIELMVVVLIIALIATVGVVALKNARAKARDARRIFDINQYAKAMRLYDLKNKHYPKGSDCGGSGCTGQLGWDKSSPLNTALKEFIVDPPPDPLANGSEQSTSYYYYYNEQNQQCGDKATVSVQNMETSKAEYYQNACQQDPADYLIILE